MLFSRTFLQKWTQERSLEFEPGLPDSFSVPLSMMQPTHPLKIKVSSRRKNKITY